jgi:NAD-dependent dihydropyrimidine dehydrogenase PreA subunit
MAKQQQTRIIYCDCGHSDVVPEKIKNSVKRALEKSGYPYEAVPDLCRLAAEGDGCLAKYGNGEPVKLVACHPRAVQWLFHADGTKLPATAEILDMRAQSAESIIETLPIDGKEARPRAEQRGSLEGLEKKGEWVPWFPVIDYDRCTGCKQCMSFCLFNVFGLTEDGEVKVKNPRNCKTNCPACARICPEVAIIFPKYGTAPIDGSEVGPDAKKEHVKVDLSKLVQGDVYAKLRRRGSSKKPRFRSLKEMKKAMDERCRCSALFELQKKLDIPPEIMESLSQCDCGCYSRAKEEEKGKSSCSDCCCE